MELRQPAIPVNNHIAKKTILFSHSYFLRLDPKQWKQGLPYAPLGTLYAAAYLRELGFQVLLHDVQFDQGPNEILPVLEKHSPGYFVIYDDGFNYLTKMCLTNMRNAAFKMIDFAKRNNCLVIVCSSDATDHANKYLDAGADYVITGEGELSLGELLVSMEKGQNPETIDGLIYKNDGVLIRTKKRELVKNLDSLPLPAWDLMDMKPYQESWKKNKKNFSINMVTTRGCPFKCNWCAKPIYGNRYHTRTPRHVIDEIKWLQQKFHMDHIWFCDDIFGLKPGWVEEFADLVEEEKISIRFKIQSRADLLVQENYVQALAKAGCESVWMGAESGSQQILDAMDKGIKTEQISAATILLKKYGIRPSFFIQFGYPGENMDDINLTMDMINRLLPAEIGISVSYPLPGTKFYENVKMQLDHKSNWSDSDEMALMFKNNYPPRFYKQLHKYVHGNYRKHLAFENLCQFLKNPLKADLTMIKKLVSGVYLFPAVLFARHKLLQLEKMS